MITDFNDLEPRGFEQQPNININKRAITMESKTNNKGITALMAVIAFIISIGQAIKKSLEDDAKITVTDMFNFFKPVQALPGAIAKLPEVPAELADEITADEEAEILTAIQESGFVPDDSKGFIKDTLDLIVHLKNYIFKHFIKQ